LKGREILCPLFFTFSSSETMPGVLTSASGVLGFLADEEPELKVFALQTLNDDIDTLWTEVAGSVAQM
jgi:26S proteasome regulatory subunit N2